MIFPKRTWPHSAKQAAAKQQVFRGFERSRWRARVDNMEHVTGGRGGFENCGTRLETPLIMYRSLVPPSQLVLL